MHTGKTLAALMLAAMSLFVAPVATADHVGEEITCPTTNDYAAIAIGGSQDDTVSGSTPDKWRLDPAIGAALLNIEPRNGASATDFVFNLYQRNEVTGECIVLAHEGAVLSPASEASFLPSTLYFIEVMRAGGAATAKDYTISFVGQEA